MFVNYIVNDFLFVKTNYKYFFDKGAPAIITGFFGSFEL